MTQNFIDGELVDSVSGATMPIADPSTGEKYGTAPISTEQDIDNAYAAASRAFADWKRTTPSQRQKALLDFADDVEKHAESLVAAEGRAQPRTPPALTPRNRRSPPVTSGTRTRSAGLTSRMTRRTRTTRTTTTRRATCCVAHS
mgnify:CR=1 FL=1